VVTPEAATLVHRRLCRSSKKRFHVTSSLAEDDAEVEAFAADGAEEAWRALTQTGSLLGNLCDVRRLCDDEKSARLGVACRRCETP
jgi:hypothetical protein